MSVDREIIQQNNNNMEEMQMQPGEPEVSPGEENHDTNPIDLVQNGEKSESLQVENLLFQVKMQI